MRPIALAALTAALVPVPAAADAPGPYCTVSLVDAAAGQSAGCATLPPGPAFGETWRSMTFAVSNGIVHAELGCGGDPVLRDERTVAGPGRASGQVRRDSFCWLTLTAVTDGASAAGLSYPAIVMR